MKRIGIDKVNSRIREASRHLDRLVELSNSLDVPAFEYEWFKLITAINSAHEILKTTAKTNPTSKQLFAKAEKHTIRKDPLLRFMLHARGADHHGLSSCTSPDVTGAQYLRYEKNPGISVTMKGYDGSEQRISGGAIVLAGNTNSFTFKYKLVPVTDDRDGTIYDPPTDHLGQSLNKVGPILVARLAISYYEVLVGLLNDTMKA